MMVRLKTLVLHDLRMQWRYGIIAAYSFVIFFYIVLLLLGGERIPPWLVATTIYTDPAALGFFFLGGLMMLEKSEDVRAAMAVTPISALEYLLSKTITLSSIALVAIVILAVAAGVDTLKLPLLFAVVMPTSVFFVSMGVLVAQRTKTVTAYIMGSIPVIVPVVAPMFLVLLDPYPLWLNAIPTTAQFWLILVTVGAVTASTLQVVATLVVVSLFATVLFWLAQRQLQQEFGHK